MEYLIFLPGESFGGLEIQMVNRAFDAEIKGSGSVLLCSKNSRIEKYANEKNVPIVNFKIKLFYFNIFAAYKVVKIILKNNIKSCIFGSTKHLSIGIIAKFFLSVFYKKSIKIVLFQQMQSGIKKKDFIHNWIYKNLDRAIVLTNDMRNSLLQNTILNNQKILVNPYGLDLETFEKERNKKLQNRRDFDFDKNDFLIGYIARFDESKDQITAIKSFYKAGIENSMLILAGSVDKAKEYYYDECMKLIDDLKLDSKIIILPFTNEIPKLMSCFDLFIMPSQSETFGLVIIEAMAAGVPVIASESGGVPEIIENHVTGLLFNPKDYERLSELMKYLYENPARRKFISENALESVKIKYEYKTQSEKFFEFVEKNL